MSERGRGVPRGGGPAGGPPKRGAPQVRGRGARRGRKDRPRSPSPTPMILLKPRAPADLPVASGTLALPDAPQIQSMMAVTAKDVPEPPAPKPVPPKPVPSEPPRAKAAVRGDREDNEPRRPGAWESGKLINKVFEFRSDQVKKILTENNDFLVVGIIGRQGVGKSTILSYLHGHGVKGTGAPSSHAFPPQSPDMVIEARHGTMGIDAAVTPERIILLDSQPIHSASILRGMIQRDGRLPPMINSQEALADLQSLQLAVFLKAVCHVVVVVSDNPVDAGLVQFLGTVDMVKYRIADVTVGTGAYHDGDPEHFADMVFVANKLEPDCLRPPFLAAMQRSLNVVFQHAPFPKHGWIAPPQLLEEENDKDTPGVPADGQIGGIILPRGRTAARGAPRDAAERAGVNFFCFPYDEAVIDRRARHRDDGRMLCGSFERNAERLRDLLLSFPRRPFAAPVSELEWLRGAARVWDAVQKSPFIADYTRTLQKMHLYST